MEKYRIGLRAQDIQVGLKEVSSGLIEAHLRKTRLIGMAVRLALTLRGPENYVISDEEKLIVVAGELGIGYEALTPTLNVLEEVEFARVQRNGETIQRVEVSVPALRDSYSELGEYWNQAKRTDIESVTVDLLDTLALGPMTKDEIAERYNLGDREIALILEIGGSAGYLDTGEVNEIEVVYSPLFWEENPTKSDQLDSTVDLTALRSALARVREYQGLPSERLKFSDTAAGALSGILPAAAVDSTGGEHEFLFTPWGDVAPEERQILDNARALVACVRYGQNFATITRIPDDVVMPLLNKLATKHEIGPHTEIKQQYSALVLRGLGAIVPSRQRPGRLLFKLNTTPENIRSVKMAMNLVELGEPGDVSGTEDAARTLLHSSVYRPPAVVRMDIKKRLRGSASREEVLSKVNAILRGVSPDLA